MKYNALEEEKQEQIERLEALGVEKERIEEMERLKKENYFEYVVRTAREKLGLYFPDEEIYYNDLNP
jgi:cell division protein FtsB